MVKKQEGDTMREQVYWLDTVDSTNLACKRLAAEGAPDGDRKSVV